MINTLKSIHYSRKEYKQDLTEEQSRRLEICRSCEFNSENNKNMGFKGLIFLQLNKLLNRFYGLRVLLSSMCLICGCQLVFITTQEDEENKCRLKKW